MAIQDFRARAVEAHEVVPAPDCRQAVGARLALMIIRVRAALLAVRTSLVNTARGLAKSMGERLPKCDADQMGVLQAVSLPPKLRQVLEWNHC